MSTASIPFSLSFRADSDLIDHISTCLGVEIIKQTLFYAGGSFSIQEGIVASGEILQLDDEPPDFLEVELPPSPSPSCTSPMSLTSSTSPVSLVHRKVMKGTIATTREGGETSWKVPGIAEQKVSSLRTWRASLKKYPL